MKLVPESLGAVAVVLLASFAAACGGNSPTSPSSPLSVSGVWAGIGSDSSTSSAAGGMMGQADMGTMTWQLTQNGSMVTGPMSFSGSGMPGRTPGTFVGTMAGDEMTFTMDMPTTSMMSAGCSSKATGTAHVDRTAMTMTMTGTYSGSNVCSGTFTSGQMTMSRR